MTKSRAKGFGALACVAALAGIGWQMSGVGLNATSASQVQKGDNSTLGLRVPNAVWNGQRAVPAGLSQGEGRVATAEKQFENAEPTEADRVSADSVSKHAAQIVSPHDQMNALMSAASALVALAAEPIFSDELWAQLESLGFSLKENKAGHPMTGLRLEWTGRHVSGASAQAQFFLDEGGEPFFDSMTLTLPASSTNGKGLRKLHDLGAFSAAELVPVRGSDQLIVFRVDDQHRTLWAREDSVSKTVQVTLEQTECEHGVAFHESGHTH